MNNNVKLPNFQSIKDLYFGSKIYQLKYFFDSPIDLPFIFLHSLESAFGEDVVKDPIIEPVPAQPSYEPVVKKTESPIRNIKGFSALANVLDASRSPPMKENLIKGWVQYIPQRN